jgi:hypothetical protein
MAWKTHRNILQISCDILGQSGDARDLRQTPGVARRRFGGSAFKASIQNSLCIEGLDTDPIVSGQGSCA